MDTIIAFAMGETNRGNELMVFDWEKAAMLIKERNATEASAGLSGDWEYTGGRILTNGKPVKKEDTYCYLASTWATPEIKIDGIIIDCYKMESETPGWDSDTFWPKEALNILNGAAE